MLNSLDMLTIIKYTQYAQYVQYIQYTQCIYTQWSLEYITVALYTMTKTTSILFILGFGLALGLEKKVSEC